MSTSSKAGFSWDDSAAKRAVSAGADTGVGKALDEILALSQRYVPEDDSILLVSGGVSGPVEGVGAVSYDTPYAVRQHEELDWKHPKAGAKAKYLESAATELVTQSVETIAAALTDELGG